MDTYASKIGMVNRSLANIHASQIKTQVRATLFHFRHLWDDRGRYLEVNFGTGPEAALLRKRHISGACKNESVLVRVLSAVLMACILGGTLIRGLEKLGHFGILFMPAVGYGIGALIRTSAGHSYSILGALAVISAFVAAMLTHVPSSYSMFRKEFGGPPVRSLLLSLTESLNYPFEASKRYPFYGLMLLLSLAAAGWQAIS